MGRHPTGKVPNQPLLLISSRHREIMRRLVAGETQHQIAVEMGITEARLSVICNSPLFKRKLADLSDEVHERYVEKVGDIQGRIQGLQPQAVDVLEKIISNKEVDGKVVSLGLKKETALDILELAGSGKKKNNTVADAMGDVVKVISDGFKLAKEIRERELRELKETRETREQSVETSVEHNIHRLTDQERGTRFSIDENASIQKRDVNVRVVDCSADSASMSMSMDERLKSTNSVDVFSALCDNFKNNIPTNNNINKEGYGDQDRALGESNIVCGPADHPTVPLPLSTQHTSITPLTKPSPFPELSTVHENENENEGGRERRFA